MRLITVFFCFLLTSSVARADSLKIGYIGALTGDAAAIGTEIAKTLQVAVTDINASGGINGKSVELVLQDDGYQITKALSAYESIKGRINSNVIFMTTYGALFALGKRPETDGKVIIDTLDCNDHIVRISGMHTCVATRTESIAETFLAVIRERGGGPVGVLYEDEAWFNFLVAAVRRGHRGEVVEINAPVQAADYRAEVLKLKSSNVRHIIFLGNDSMGRAMKQARDIGIEANFYSIASVMSPGFQSLAQEALEVTVVSNWTIPVNEFAQKFSRRFEEVNGRKIQLEFVAGPTADAARLLFDTLRALGDWPSGQAIRQEMPNHEPFHGVSGTIKMDADGAVRSILEIPFVYQRGKLVSWAQNASAR